MVFVSEHSCHNCTAIFAASAFISAVLAILGLVLLMMEVITAHDTMQAYTLSGVTMSYSFGFYLMIVSLLLVLFSGPIKNWKKRH